MAKVTITLSLDDERDRDVVQWLRGLPYGQRSEILRAAIRAHIDAGNGASVGLVYQELMEVKRLLQAGWVAVPGDGDGRQDPLVAEAGRKIKNLGL